MARRKEPDKLSREVAQALACGMSYGKWKAMQPVKPLPRKLGDYEYICLNCGKVCVSPTMQRRKYCDALCGQQYRYKRDRERLKNGKAENVWDE